ncbi:hypothetical protein VitviT2T_022843 [Vitis vinifera]|uniref:Retrotransposon Copia-like N-terminal domain-containing protein n=1 Tax=Vitis vinifera TaxID=29760 RepID=A0ABY9DDP9_VITVI|nr:hypothetical protein VitviT2T_022843 [Vitis vinifera]
MASPDTNSSTLTFESNGTNGSFDPHYPSPVSFKLEGPNYLGWQSLFLPFLRSNSLLEFVDGSKPTPNKDLPDNTLNPTYGIWFRKDQALLGCIPSSIIETLVSILYGLDSSRPILDYLQTAKALADQLAAAGKPVDDQDLISYIIDGLQLVFNPFITSYNFASRDKELTIDEFNAELLSYEALIDSQCVYLASNTTHFALTTSKQKPSLSQEKRSLPCKQLDPHRTLGKLVPPMSRRTHKRQGQIRDNMPQEITSNVKYMWENWSYSS